MPNFSSTLPPLKTVEDLADLLELSEFSLKRYCLRTSSFYNSFERRKRNGHGRRLISAPVDELKRIQRKIKSAILENFDPHPASMGYRKGISIVDNAELHTGKRCVFNMDIRDFFQSISTARVAGLFLSLGFDEELAVILSRLCCFSNSLPQGAPSSPAIANLICHRLDRRLAGLARACRMTYSRYWLDRRLAGLARACRMTYSRYCDDITISADRRINQATMDLIFSIVKEEGFSVNEDKTRVLSRKSCQIVTGLTVNVKVNIPRRRRRRIRAVLHQAGNLPALNPAYGNYLKGLASYAAMVRQKMRRCARVTGI